MKRSRFVFRMRTGAIRVLQGDHEKNGAMLGTWGVGWEGGRQAADRHPSLIDIWRWQQTS